MKMGTSVAIPYAINYYLQDLASPSFAFKDTLGYIYSPVRLKQFLDDGHVLLALLEQYVISEGELLRAAGHAVLISGYVEIEDELWLIIKDPYSVGVCNTYMMSYDAFCFGYTSYEDQIPRPYLWVSTICYETSYCSDTIDTRYDDLLEIFNQINGGAT